MRRGEPCGWRSDLPWRAAGAGAPPHAARPRTAPIPRPTPRPPGAAAPRVALDDETRLRAVDATRLVDGPPSPALDAAVARAAAALGAPVALVSLVHADRQFLASAVGLEEPWASCRQTPLSHSLCRHVVLRQAPLAIADARQDPEFRSNGAVTDLGFVAYLGVPLVLASRYPVGACCVLDVRPRQWTDADLATLRAVAEEAIREIERGALALEDDDTAQVPTRTGRQ